ncbi:MAG TPA: mechanosensitive ion channel family protein [Bacilli bacterium]
MTNMLAAKFAFYEKFIGYFTEPETWLDIAATVLKIVLIYIVGKIVKKIIVKAIGHVLKERDRNPLKIDQRRAATLGKLAGNIVSYVIDFIVILMILSQLGVDLAPLLAGAGVIGLAIGFGAQSLVKDVISGFFIIFEDQFGVGDVIQTGNYYGTVEEIGLRVTRIKSWKGEVHIIPNGSISEVTNYSLNNSVAVVDIALAYSENIDRALEIIRSTMRQISTENEDIVKEPDVLGLQAISASEVVVRVTCECKPLTHFGVERQIKAEVKKKLDEAGIGAPYPHMVMIQKS